MGSKAYQINENAWYIQFGKHARSINTVGFWFAIGIFFLLGWAIGANMGLAVAKAALLR